MRIVLASTCYTVIAVGFVRGGTMDKTRRDEQDAWERMDGVLYQIDRIGICGDVYKEAARLKMNRNQSAIAASKLQNKQLRSALNNLRERERMSLGQNDLKKMEERVRSLRKLYNERREQVIAKTILLQQQVVGTQLAEMELDDVRDTKAPSVRRLESLHVALDVTLQKLKDARVVQKTYEQMLKPLRDERAIYDAQVDTMSRTVKRKQKAEDQLKLMQCNAQRTREETRVKLQELVIANFQPGTRYYPFFSQAHTREGREVGDQIRSAIAEIKEALHFESMSDVHHAVIQQARRSRYLLHCEKELGELVDALKCGTGGKNIHDRVLKARRTVLACNFDDSTKKQTEVYKQALVTMIEGARKLLSKLHPKVEDKSVFTMEEGLSNALKEVLQWTHEIRMRRAKEQHAWLHDTCVMVMEKRKENIHVLHDSNELHGNQTSSNNDSYD